MAVVAALYDAWLADALGGTSSGGAPNCDWLSDATPATIHTATYSPSKTAHDRVDDLTNEVTGTNYTSGGQNLMSKTLAITSSVIIGDAADPVWTSATITGRIVVVSDRTPSGAANQPLICYQKSDVDISSTNGNWTFQLAASGLFRLTVSAEA